VDEALAERWDNLKGPAIAIDVFGRGAEFDPVTDSIVRTEARRVRQVLDSHYAGPGADDPVRIVVPKGTYAPRFERRAETGGPAGASLPRAALEETGRADPGTGVRDKEQPRVSAKRLIPVYALAIVAVVGGMAYWLQATGSAHSDTATTPSMLVRPFKPIGDQSSTDVLAEGLTVRLIADLMKFPDFRLYSFEDALQLDLKPHEMREEDDPDYIVTGNVRVEEDGVSVAVRLVRAADNRVLWSEVYSEPKSPERLSELEARISGEIASVIAQPYGIVRTEIARDIGEDARSAAMSSFTCVMQAYSYRHSNQSGLYAPVRACLEEAVVRDPEYAEAWAMLGYLRLDGGRFGHDGPAASAEGSAYAAARAAAARALTLDPESVQALKALSTVEFYLGNYEESHRLAREAVELNPNDPGGLGQLGWRLGVRGEFDEAIPYLEQAIARSVRPPPWYFQPIALERMMLGDMPGMLVAAERAEVDRSAPSAALLAIAQAGVGRMEEARESVRIMSERWPLLGEDPARALAIHHVDEEIIAVFVDGLRNAGWYPTSGG
jgi:TolB-like protein